jgi:hypothetical protein
MSTAGRQNARALADETAELLALRRNAPTRTRAEALKEIVR